MTMPVTVTKSAPGMDRETCHELSDPRFAIWELPRGKERFHVIERGAGTRGTGRTRGKAKTLDAALELVGSLTPSTAAEILAGIGAYGDHDRALIRKLTELGMPGTPLFVLAGDRDYESVSEGLAISGAEAMFGQGDLGCWLIGWRDPEGEPVRGLYCMAREDAERAWWILRDGEVVAGGPPIFDESRALELAEKFGGTAVKGTGWANPDPAPVTRCSRCKRPLRSGRTIGRRCEALERAEKREAVIELAIAPWSKQQRDDAKALIKAGRLEPTKRAGLYEITSSDKVTVYLTSALSCGCTASRHGRLCYHRAAAAVADAYIAFNEALRTAA